MLTRRSFVVSAAASLIAAPALARMMPVVDTPPEYVPPSLMEQKEIQNFFANSASGVGGCCGVADGFMRGFTYRIWIKGTDQDAYRYDDVVVFKDLEMRPNGYWVEVYDTYQDKYVWAPAPEQTWVKRPNPTGYYIVWTYYPHGFCEVRCLALKAEM